MTTTSSPDTVLTRYADAMDTRDWTGLRALLAPGFSSRLLHTGESFDADSYVAFNRDYPGRWRFQAEDVVASGERSVLCARVSDAESTYFVAVFATTTDGLLSAITEVWTEAVQPHPDRSST